MKHNRPFLILRSSKLTVLKILLLSLIPLPLFGQESKLNFSKIDSANPFKLPSLSHSKYNIYIRVSFPGKIIDLFNYEGQSFKGILTTYVVEYASVKDKETGDPTSKEVQYIYQKIDLDSISSTIVAVRLLGTGQDTIPTDTLIKPWDRMFFDCSGIQFEFNVNGKYVKQDYSCPWGQNDSNAYVKTILANCDSISKELNIEAHYHTFTNYLQKGKTYSSNGMGMMYIMTQKQERHWEKIKPYIEYLDSIEITLNKYLSDTLTQLFKVYGAPACSDQFSLKFSKNNKLTRITTDSKFLGSEDRKNYHNCKKKIKEAFQHIQIGFIHSKIAYWRKLDFWDNKVSVFDNYYKIDK